MKPKNKKQMRILEMSGRLRPLTSAQKRWAFSHTIDHYAYRLKSGMAVCMDCGHEWKEVGFGIYRCPNCGERVEIRNTKERVRRDKSYFNVITAMGEYQIVRMFLMIVEMRKGMKANPAFLEIGQYWIDPKGYVTVVGLQRTMGLYIDSFAFGSPFEIRSDNDAFRHIAGEWVYPRIKSTAMLRRNGFKGWCHSMHPVTLFRQLLTNPKAETLMKYGDIEVLRYLCQHPEDVNKYWDSIKIARRAGYTIEDPTMWFDYVRMLERMGRDLHSPSLVAPEDLRIAHDEYVAKVARQRLKEKREADRKMAEAHQAEFERLKGCFAGLTITDGTIYLHTLDSIEEYYVEGERQHICVGSSCYYLKPDTLVLTATKDGRTIATVEISLRDYSVIQCRAFANGVCGYTERIAAIVAANRKVIAKRRTA